MKNNLRIVFDANPLAVPNKTGVGMYTEGLIRNLVANYPNLKLIGYYYNFLGRKKPNLPKNENIKYKPIYFYPGKLVNVLRRLKIEVPVEMLSKTKADVCLFPNFLSQPSLFKTPSIPVIHDLSFIDYPEFSSDRNRKDLIKFLPKTLKRASRVITVSEFSKKVIVNKLHYEKEDILVTYIPPESSATIKSDEGNRILKKFNINKPFMLFVGTLEPRKNLINLLIAYEKSKELNSNYSLLIAGGIDWKFEEILNKINELKSSGMDVIHTGYLTKADRNTLYSRAEVFVSPSHYEGFGMPVLEAMSYKIPVCLSDIPVFHEIAGDAAVYFDKDDTEDIALKINSCLYKEARKILIEKGQIQLQKYSWDKVVEKVYSAIKDLAKN